MDYKYNLSVCLCIKNEGKYMPEFLDHYINQGVDHFYIVNNNSSDNIDEVINNPKYENLITFIIDNRDMKILMDDSGSYGHKTLLDENIYPLIIQESKWAIVVDSDEFMFGKNGYTIKTYISELEDHIGCVYVIWNIINPLINEDGTISETFSITQNKKRLNHDLINTLSWNIQNANNFGKSIFRTSMLSEHNKLWLHKVKTSGTTINNYNVVSNDFYDNNNNIPYSEITYKDLKITLNHYAIRNFEDYKKKEGQLENVKTKVSFINGLFEILKLSDEHLISDDYFI